MNAGLFGLVNSNRDFRNPEVWGKNQFNSSFPAALLCYMQSRDIKSIYLKYSPTNNEIVQDFISTNDVFGMQWNAPNIFFAFEEKYEGFTEVLIGKTPPIDLVIINKDKGKHIRGLEIKLTAVPDSTTCTLNEADYGTELVFRQPTIAYGAANICLHFKNRRAELRREMGVELDNIRNWENEHEVLLSFPIMVEKLIRICNIIATVQVPLIIQPVWKTIGKSSILSNDCLDCFVWSDVAFIMLLLLRTTLKVVDAQNADRSIRAIIWIMKMLYDFNLNGRFAHKEIMDKLSFRTKNDKALSINGTITNQYMRSSFLTKPRISKLEIKNIIQGRGIEYLSPERRFDAVIANDKELFS